MKEKMKLLIGLQNCDTQIRNIQQRKAESPLSLQKLEANLVEMKGRLETGAEQLQTRRRERRQMEQEIEALESRIEKSHTKLSSIKSNREYQAALKEIDDLRGETRLLEDKVLEIMEETESFEGRVAADREQLRALEDKTQKDREAVERQLETLSSQLEALEMERSRFCRAIDDELLKRYNFLVERKGGLAVSPVIKSVCQSCHLGIPPQVFNEVIRGEELLTCPNCSRMIYWGEDEGFSEVGQNGESGMLE